MINVGNLLGSKFGRLKVVKDAGLFPCNNGSKNGGRRRYVEVICDCGVKKTIRLSKVISGEIKSCGCYQRELNKKLHTTHGLIKHPLYGVWYTIKTRCYNKLRLPGLSYENIYGFKNISGIFLRSFLSISL